MDKKRLAAKETATDWKAPAMPPMAQGQARGEMLLLSPLDGAPGRPAREANEPEPAPARVVTGAPANEVEGPASPPLPRSALVLTPTAPSTAMTNDDDRYSPQSRARLDGRAATPDLDLARPALPLASRVLLPR
jgi:hypothetical protein